MDERTVFVGTGSQSPYVGLGPAGVRSDRGYLLEGGGFTMLGDDVPLGGDFGETLGVKGSQPGDIDSDPRHDNQGPGSTEFVEGLADALHEDPTGRGAWDFVTDYLSGVDWYDEVLGLQEITPLENWGDDYFDGFCVSQYFPFPTPQILSDSASDFECVRAINRIARNLSDCPPPRIGCSSDGHEYTSDCANIININRSQSMIVVGEVDPIVQTVNGVSIVDHWEISFPFPDEVAALNAAWNILQANSDIVYWLACLLRGKRKAKCLIDILFDIDSPQKIVVEETISRQHSNALMYTNFNTIYVNRNADPWAYFVTNFLSHDSENKACMAMYVAGALLHEMFHICLGFVEDSRDSANNCDTTYMLESSFIWAMVKRYPCMASKTDCVPGEHFNECNTFCSHFEDDCFFMNDDEASLQAEFTCAGE